MRFEILGPVRIDRGGEPIPLTSERQRAILANLLIAAGDVVAADRLIDAVWGEDLPENPSNALQHGIAQLRKLLEPGRVRGDPPQVLRSEPGGYRLVLDDVESDVAEFERLVDEGRRLLAAGAEGAAVESIAAGLALWRGSAYADFAHADFAHAEIDRLEERRIQATELMLEARAVAEGPTSVIPDLEAMVVAHPFQEALWAKLMTALYQSGRQAEALRAFRRASDALGEELGIEPSAELRSLEEQILLQDPSLDASPRSATRHNLPASATRLIGREAELAGVMSHVRSSRLTTLTGPGGSGKTRLALEAAHGVVDEFREGVRLVRLEDLADPDLLAPAIGEAVGMPENRESTVIETLTTFLADKRMLLVLDNGEHLIEAVAGLVDRILAGCPEITVLLTSQIALSITGEQRVPLPPLRLPGEAGTPFEEIGEVPAVELFLERASATDPGLVPSPEVVSAAANIVKALDGIPLAIELAAARTDVLTPVEIARRLADRFAVLDAGRRDAPERQRTLRNVVEWSYRLLGPDEQDFFNRLSVFAGGFTVEAAAVIAGTTETDALTMLHRLVQRSLIVRETGAGGRSRYRLLETLRLYGIDRLDDDATTAAVRDRHLDNCAAATRALDTRLVGHEQSAAFREFIDEQDNLRAAMAWSLESGRLAPGISIAAWVSRFWDWRGSLAEAATWMRRFIEAGPDDEVPDLAFLTSWAGYFAWELGDAARARELTDEALRIADRQEDAFARGAALTIAAVHARNRGDSTTAVRHNAEVRGIALAVDEPWLAAWADNHDGLSLLATGDVKAAREAAEASKDGFERLGDRRAVGWALTVLAQIAHESSNPTEAIDLATAAAALSREAGDGRNAAWALELAAAAADPGDTDAAERYAEEASALLLERGMPNSPWRRTS